MDTNVRIRFLDFIFLLCAHPGPLGPSFCSLVCKYMAHVMLFIRHISSWPRLTDDLCFTLYARAEQLKQLFWFITDQNKCACKVLKKSTLLLCSTVFISVFPRVISWQRLYIYFSHTNWSCAIFLCIRVTLKLAQISNGHSLHDSDYWLAQTRLLVHSVVDECRSAYDLEWWTTKNWKKSVLLKGQEVKINCSILNNS